MTFGQEVGRLGPQHRAVVLTASSDPPPSRRAAARWHRSRHRTERSGRVRRGRVDAPGARPGLPSPKRATTSRRSRARTRSSRPGAMLKVVALSMNKIAGDLRLLGSGPTAGFGEIRLPDAAGRELDHARQGQPGDPGDGPAGRARRSSATTPRSRSRRRCRRCRSTRRCRSQHAACCRRSTFWPAQRRCSTPGASRGIEVDEARMRRNAERSPAIVTALAPRIGYDAAAKLVHQAEDQGVSLAELLDSGHGLRRRVGRRCPARRWPAPTIRAASHPTFRRRRAGGISVDVRWGHTLATKDPVDGVPGPDQRC